MGQILRDIRYAVRSFIKSPLFTLVAVASLAFGIGANAAIFSLLDQVILRFLPVNHPEQLVQFRMRGQHYGSNWGMNAISYPMYRDFRDHNQVFSGMFCRFPIEASLGYGNRTERVRAELVSGNYFPVLGLTAVAGRLFTAKDDLFEGASPFTVLSYSYWQTRFAGNPSIVGKTLVVNGHNLSVVGIAQPGFNGMEVGSPAKIFIPIKMKPQMMPFPRTMDDRRWRWVNAYGRLKPGVTAQQAQASLQPFMHSMLEMEVKEPAFRNASDYTRKQFLKNVIQLLPGGAGRSYLRELIAKPLWVLLGITGMVLLLACANLANLLLARATARSKEIAIRLAIGAGRRAIARQLLIESLLLSIIGALVGIALAYIADSVLLSMYLPVDNAADAAFSAVPDGRVLAFTFGLTLLTTIIFGLVPALQSSRGDVVDTLKAQAGSVVGGANVGMRKALVAAQVGLSLLLLIGAGLFTRTLSNLRDLGPGFSPENLVGFTVDPSLVGYDDARTKLLYRQLMDTLGALPGVRSVGYASMRILEEDEWDSSVTVEGYTAKPGQQPEPYMNSISPDYFGTLGVAFLAGRDFRPTDNKVQQHSDRPGQPDLVPTTIIINEKFAKKYFAGRNPIGLHIGYGLDPNTRTDMEVIGVVKDIKYTNLRDDIQPQAYVPFAADQHPGQATIYMRTTEDPRQLMSIVRQKIHALDPSLPVFDVRTTDEQISRSLRNERLIASLSSLFGTVATLLAIIGLYGVLAYTVSRKTREIGIRMALGAIKGHVIWMVMREMLLLVAIGIGVGLPAAIGLSSLVRNQLYGLAPHDPATLLLATIGLLLIACLAGFIPALRASRIDPTRALRYE